MITCTYVNTSDIFNNEQFEVFSNIVMMSQYTYGTNNLTLISRIGILSEVEQHLVSDNNKSIEDQIMNIVRSLPDSVYINLEN